MRNIILRLLILGGMVLICSTFGFPQSVEHMTSAIVDIDGGMSITAVLQNLEKSGWSEDKDQTGLSAVTVKGAKVLNMVYKGFTLSVVSDSTQRVYQIVHNTYTPFEKGNSIYEKDKETLINTYKRLYPDSSYEIRCIERGQFPYKSLEIYILKKVGQYDYTCPYIGKCELSIGPTVGPYGCLGYTIRETDFSSFAECNDYFVDLADFSDNDTIHVLSMLYTNSYYQAAAEHLKPYFTWHLPAIDGDINDYQKKSSFITDPISKRLPKGTRALKNKEDYYDNAPIFVDYNPNTKRVWRVRKNYQLSSLTEAYELYQNLKKKVTQDVTFIYYNKTKYICDIKNYQSSYNDVVTLPKTRIRIKRKDTDDRIFCPFIGEVTVSISPSDYYEANVNGNVDSYVISVVYEDFLNTALEMPNIARIRNMLRDTSDIKTIEVK